MRCSTRSSSQEAVGITIVDRDLRIVRANRAFGVFGDETPAERRRPPDRRGPAAPRLADRARRRSRCCESGVPCLGARGRRGRPRAIPRTAAGSARSARPSSSTRRRGRRASRRPSSRSPTSSGRSTSATTPSCASGRATPPSTRRSSATGRSSTARPWASCARIARAASSRRTARSSRCSGTPRTS